MITNNTYTWIKTIPKTKAEIVEAIQNTIENKEISIWLLSWLPDFLIENRFDFSAIHFVPSNGFSEIFIYFDTETTELSVDIFISHRNDFLVNCNGFVFFDGAIENWFLEFIRIFHPFNPKTDVEELAAIMAEILRDL